jgi:hypothetical protein
MGLYLIECAGIGSECRVYAGTTLVPGGGKNIFIIWEMGGGATSGGNQAAVRPAQGLQRPLSPHEER